MTGTTFILKETYCSYSTVSLEESEEWKFLAIFTIRFTSNWRSHYIIKALQTNHHCRYLWPYTTHESQWLDLPLKMLNHHQESQSLRSQNLNSVIVAHNLEVYYANMLLLSMDFLRNTCALLSHHPQISRWQRLLLLGSRVSCHDLLTYFWLERGYLHL